MSSYFCIWCEADHDETPAIDYSRPLLPGHCTAQFKADTGAWRACHAPHDKYGVVHVGEAHLCRPCWDTLEASLSSTVRQVLRGPTPDWKARNVWTVTDETIERRQL